MSSSFEIYHQNGRTMGQRILAKNGNYWLVTFFRTEGAHVIEVIPMRSKEVAAMLKLYGFSEAGIGRIIEE